MSWFKANKRLLCLRECRKSQFTTRGWPYVLPNKNEIHTGICSTDWSGLPQYLADEIENTQNRSMNILRTPRDNLQTLQERRDIIAMKEFKRIQSDTTHPFNKFIPSPISRTYDLRKDSVLPQPVSCTNRHQSSFIARAISILKNQKPGPIIWIWFAQ